MARAGKSQIDKVHLDTHIVLWLFDKELDRLSSRSKEYIDNSVLYYSPLVHLELQYLYEIKRIRDKPDTILTELLVNIVLQSSELSFDAVIRQAVQNTWTRDVFDRVIVADAQINNAPLITADKTIQKHYKKALI